MQLKQYVMQLTIWSILLSEFLHLVVSETFVYVSLEVLYHIFFGEGVRVLHCPLVLDARGQKGKLG